MNLIGSLFAIKSSSKNYLEPVMGSKKVISTVARMMQVFARDNLPRAVTFILSAGKLVALNKQEEKVNAELYSN